MEDIKMKEFKYVVTDNEGIHARPAGELVKLVKGFESTISIEKELLSSKRSPYSDLKGSFVSLSFYFHFPLQIQFFFS